MIILMRIDFMLRPVITDSEEERGGEEGEQRSTKLIKSLCSTIRKGAGDSEIIPTFVDTAIPYQNIIEVGNFTHIGPTHRVRLDQKTDFILLYSKTGIDQTSFHLNT